MPQNLTTYLTAPRNLIERDEARPAPAAGEVLIELTAVGVCGSDVHWYLDGRIGETLLADPLTLGHEPAGNVIGLGEGVDPALLGRRVAIEPAMHCGRCKFCLEGKINICPNVRFMGTPPTQGAYRQFLTHPAALIVPLPDSISDEVGALLEPLAIAVHIMDRLRPKLGANVVILGAGPIGLTALMAMRLHAPAKVVVIEPLEYRRALATELGADVVFSPEDPNHLAEIRRMMGGYGADYVIEAVGRPETFARMVDYAEPGATVAVVGIDPHDRFAFNNSVARRKGLDVLMIRRSRATLHRAVEITAGGFWPAQALITHRRGLGSLAPCMDMVAAREDGVIKAIIDPRT